MRTINQRFRGFATGTKFVPSRWRNWWGAPTEPAYKALDASIRAQHVGTRSALNVLLRRLHPAVVRDVIATFLRTEPRPILSPGRLDRARRHMLRKMNDKYMAAARDRMRDDSQAQLTITVHDDFLGRDFTWLPQSPYWCIAA